MYYEDGQSNVQLRGKEGRLANLTFKIVSRTRMGNSSPVSRIQAVQKLFQNVLTDD